jgi:hypothetical protein
MQGRHLYVEDGNCLFARGDSVPQKSLKGSKKSMKELIDKLLSNPDIASTQMGTLLVILGSVQLDMQKIFQWDPTELSKLASLGLVWGVCYFVGKQKKEKQ